MGHNTWDAFYNTTRINSKITLKGLGTDVVWQGLDAATVTFIAASQYARI
jgi:hypothetical protein